MPVGPPVRSPHLGRKKGQGNSYPRGALGQAAVGAARTATFLGERHGRIARRRGRAKAQASTDTDRRLRNHIRQIQALGFDVNLTSTG